MNLDSCTQGQCLSIKHVDGPLLVSAGAGSGKTFTLTQRIAYALLPESGPAASGIDEVLAITFTEKAAAEIKARVKRTLRSEGLHAEALKVDGAWISTIHGMCARILKTHALDLGIDPAFGIVGEAERSDLLSDAINRALGDDNDIIAHGSYAALFDEFTARSAQPFVPSIASMVQALLNKAVGLRGGLDVVDFGPPPARVSVLVRELLLAYENVQGALEQAGESTTALKARVQASEAIDVLQAFIAERGSVTDIEHDDASAHANLRAFAAAVNSCARVGGNFKATVKPAVKEFQAVYEHTARCIVLGLAYPLAAELLALARVASRHYEAAKRSVDKLDNDDLLTRTLAAFEEHPEIEQRYEKRFKLVMVDEFQDTSQLQIDMITRLAGADCAHLCTVGDAQQSIYRFRGADVNVYEAHKRAMRSPEVGACYVELTKNFRSHADVLAFVDRVFEQPRVFGDAFMSLEPHLARPTSYRTSQPRIDLVLALQPSGNRTGVTVDDAKQSCAQGIARRFAALRAEGHTPGDMVVLLGKMSRSGMYAEALRAEGFECVVTGGSLFASAPEVRVVARFVEALANPANTAALFEVLTSDMVHLAADDLLKLATAEDPETGELSRRNLDRGFSRLAKQVESLPPRLAHAVRLLTAAQQAARTQPVALVVRDAVLRCGWMARLERDGATGIARAANVLKAIRLIDEIESERHLGLASTARAFADELAVGLKEAPGALSGAAGDVVKIMTIHASKGLEFPIVALADFANEPGRSSKLLVENYGSTARASLALGESLDAYPQVAKFAKFYAAEDGDDDADLAQARSMVQGGGIQGESCSQDAYRAVLAGRIGEEELAESRRKLYVGLTRASEALVVAMDAKMTTTGSYPELVEDIRSALCGAETFPEGCAELAYGGSMPARFECVMLQPNVRGEDALSEDLFATGSQIPQQFFVPHCGDEPFEHEPWRAAREDVFSYSSIAPDHRFEGAGRSCDELPVSLVRGLSLLQVLDGDLPLDLPEDRPLASDEDKATGLGSAFHRAAQYAIEAGCTPAKDRLHSLARAYELSSDQVVRLDAACERWFGSEVYAEALAWPLRRAEVPFFTRIGDALMEGEIDLLCTDGAEGVGTRAFVVDYKTGGSDEESPDELYEKHLLQAQCYAYALLTQGYVSAHFKFVRVEREDEQGDPQVVQYQFSADDCGDLERIILATRG